jgi:hypothetical protein
MLQTSTAYGRPSGFTDGIIGRVCEYTGPLAWLRGNVRIVAVIRSDALLRDESEIDAAGGLRNDDRVEVQPWCPERGRFSLVTSDPFARDLSGLVSVDQFNDHTER